MLKASIRNIVMPCALLSFLFLACTGNKNQKATEELISSEQEVVIKEVNKQYYAFPAPKEILEIVTDSTLDFNAKYLNLAENEAYYINPNQQAFNIGVYAADIAYMTSFKEDFYIMSYFEAVQDLCKEQKIEDAINKEIIERYRKNIRHKDSIVSIANESFKHIVAYLIKNKMEKKMALISAGVFIESIYIAINLIEESPKKNEMRNNILSQQYTLDNLYSFLNFFKEDEYIHSMMTSLNKIRIIYDEINKASTDEAKFEEKEDGKVVYKISSKTNISEKQYRQLKDYLFKLRNELVAI